MRRFSTLLLAASLGGCSTPGQMLPTTLAHADLVNGEGKASGRAVFTQAGDIVSLSIEARGLKPGPHGMHLHSQGKCEGPGFTTAGAHLNPAMHQHGTMNPAGPHLGDLPNLTIAADGAGATTVTMPGQWPDIASAVFDADGTAIVIHAGEDDYKTDPSGNSGGRILCGVFARD